MAEGRSLLEIIKEHSSSDELRLPVFPAVALEIQKLIAKKNFSLTEVAAIICKDQALAGEVLKIANSAFFSGFKRVSTIKDAVMRLGVKQVLNCVVMMGQRELYRSNNELFNGYMESLWKHAVTCSLGTKWFLERIGYAELAQEGFLAGLFHDIGKLLLLKVVEKISLEGDAPLSETFIRELLESMHAQEGYELMERWNIPDIYSAIARDHHKEEINADNIMLLVVRLVDQACRKIGVGMNHDPSILLPTLPEAPLLGIKEIVLAELEVVLEDAAMLN